MKSLTSHIKMNCAEYSPCGRFVASSCNSKVIIFNAEAGEVWLEFDCGDITDVLQWSEDSIHILCVTRLKNRVEVFSLANPGWVCRINAGSEGLQQAAWSPDGKHILTLSQFSIRVRIWSLESLTVGSLELSRNLNNTLLTFSACGKFMAVSPIEDSGKLRIFVTKSWKLENEIAKSFGPTNGPHWSPTGELFALYARFNLTVCDVAIFSAKTGKQVGGFQREPSKKLKGVRTLSWCRSGQLLAIGCYDDSIFILDHILWSPLTKLTHSTSISQTECSVFQLKQTEVSEIQQRPISLICADRKEPEFTPGVKFLCFDGGNEFFASVSELMPAIVRIWKVEDFSLLSVLVLEERVTALAWSGNARLAACGDRSGVTIWQPNERPIFVNVSHPTVDKKNTKTELKWQPGKCESLILQRGSFAIFLLKEF